MNTKLRDQIRTNLNTKETDELLEIWQTNDRLEWSDLTFEVLQEILVERIGVLPDQNEPVINKDDKDNELDDLEKWEAKLLDSEQQPEMYDTLEVIDLIDNINKVARAAIFIYAFVYILNSSPIKEFLVGGRAALQENPDFLWNVFITILIAVIQIAIVYFPLKALSSILRILMEMEFNSRKK